jgi:hypothetical protein
MPAATRAIKLLKNIEEECLRAMDHGRARLGLKRKDRRPATMEAFITLPDGSTERRQVDSSEVLGAISIPAYYEAGALTNRPIASVYPCDYRMIVVAPASQRLLRQSAKVEVRVSANSMTFARMLAKIALGLTVAKFGISGFEPLARNLIVNNPDEYGHWVGGFAGLQVEETPSKQFHEIRLLGAQQAGAGIFIIVEIRLFAKFGGPTNYVVVGRPLRIPMSIG